MVFSGTQNVAFLLEPSERLNIPTDFDSFEIEIVQEGKQFKVRDVYQPAIAGLAGLKPGDILLAVDGKETSNLTLVQIKRMFKLDGGETVLLVKRGGKLCRSKSRLLVSSEGITPRDVDAD